MKRLPKRLLDRRVRTYGPLEGKCRGEPLGMLVATRLSQNARDTNRDAGYRHLRRRFRSWNQLADAPVEAVQREIRLCGLWRQKAPPIRPVLRQIRNGPGWIDLRFLKDRDEQAACDCLRVLPGVGSEGRRLRAALLADAPRLFRRSPHPPHCGPAGPHRRQDDRGATARAARTDDDAARRLRLARPADRARAEDLAINARCDACPLLSMCPQGKRRTTPEPG